MNREDANRALAASESFFDYVLISVAAFPKPWTFVTVVATLIGCAAFGAWLS